MATVLSNMYGITVSLWQHIHGLQQVSSYFQFNLQVGTHFLVPNCLWNEKQRAVHTFDLSYFEEEIRILVENLMEIVFWWNLAAYHILQLSGNNDKVKFLCLR